MYAGERFLQECPNLFGCKPWLAPVCTFPSRLPFVADTDEEGISTIQWGTAI